MMTEPMTREPKPPDCATCDDSGWEPIFDAQGARRAVRHCTRCDFWPKRRGYAPGVPEVERESTFANFTVTKDNGAALADAKLFVSGVHAGLYLWGPVGTGKTRLACATLNECWKARKGVRFIRTPELFLRMNPSAEDPDKLFDDLASIPILCLDDLGASQGTDYARRVLQAIFDARVDRGNRTIWTANLDLDGLAKFLDDERLASRIAGDAKVLAMRGPDWRLKTKRSRPAGPTKSSW